jgi:hypothetical protein
MPTKENYENIEWVLDRFKDAWEADQDNREQRDECWYFINKKDGQWEPKWWELNENRPRYTFDQVSSVVDQIAGDLERRDFSVRVTPAGGSATKGVAATYDGLIRNIERMSNAEDIYNHSGRRVVVGGIDGWEVVQKYVDDNAFEQDLAIKRVGNFSDRVWFGPHEEPDASDADYCFKFTKMSEDDFKEAFPDCPMEKFSDPGRSTHAYFHKEQGVMVGEFYYLEADERELVLMSNGNVYEANEEYEKVKDDLANQQPPITEVRRRTREVRKVKTRQFSCFDWLEDEPQDTVFENWLPIIPQYGNFDYEEEKIIYWGAVLKPMDAQRVLNYSVSREIEEGAFAPRSKWLATLKMIQPYQKQWEKMNTSADPFLPYDHDEKVPAGPRFVQGGTVNQGLRTISEAMRNSIGFIMGKFAASQGDNPALQSGRAIEALQERGNVGDNKYVNSQVISQKHTGRILVNAIPRVYSPGRQVRLLQEDGTYEFQVLGERVRDEESGEIHVVNDLSQGIYDCNVDSGENYKNRQSQTVDTITTIAKVDPTILEMGGDILLNNIAAPGMSQLAARKRQQLVAAGAIPKDQLTDEEQQAAAQAAQQPKQPDALTLQAMGENKQGDAAILDAQTKQRVSEVEAGVKISDAKLRVEEQQIKRTELRIREYEAVTDRILAKIKEQEAETNRIASSAGAAHDLAKAEGQEIDNAAARSGITDVIERIAEAPDAQAG